MSQNGKLDRDALRAPNPIRLGTAAISGRIFAGRPNKAGTAFKEPRYDVTSDALKAVIEHIGAGHEVTVNVDGKPAFTITITALEADHDQG